MRKILWSLLFLVLIMVALYIWWQSSGSYRTTFKPAERNFSLDDTGRIDGILMVHHEDTLILAKTPRSWQVNGEHEVSASKMETLLTIIHRLNIRAPVEKARQEKISAALADSGKHVSLFDDHKVLRHYVMIYENHGQANTIMKLHRARQPFYMEIPGYPVQNLSYIFNMAEDFWRDPVLFDFLPAEIKRLSLIYHEEPQSSFRILHEEGHRIEVHDPAGLTVPRSIDTTAVLRYLSYFVRVEYERSWDPGDSGYGRLKMEAEPYIRVSLELHDGRSHTADLYRIPAAEDGEERTAVWDYNHFYLQFEGSAEIYRVAYLEFDPILKKRDYFIKPRQN